MSKPCTQYLTITWRPHVSLKRFRLGYLLRLRTIEPRKTRIHTKTSEIPAGQIWTDLIYPDGLTTDEAVKQLAQLAEDPNKPFFLAVGIIRPHLPFGAPAEYLEPYRNVELPPTPHPTKPQGKTTWHGSREFMKYNRWKRNPNTGAEFAIEVRRHYAACVWRPRIRNWSSDFSHD